MTRKELDRRLVEADHDENALVIVPDRDAPSGFAVAIAVGDGDVFLPITVEG